MPINNLDYPTSQMNTGLDVIAKKHTFKLLDQDADLLTIQYLENLLTLYRGNTLIAIDTFNNQYLAIVTNVYGNTCDATLYYGNNDLPTIFTIKYYEWWKNSTPSAQILDYIFIKE